MRSTVRHEQEGAVGLRIRLRPFRTGHGSEGSALLRLTRLAGLNPFVAAVADRREGRPGLGLALLVLIFVSLQSVWAGS